MKFSDALLKIGAKNNFYYQLKKLLQLDKDRKIDHHFLYLADAVLNKLLHGFKNYLYFHSLGRSTIDSAIATSNVEENIDNMTQALGSDDINIKMQVITLALNTAHMSGKMIDWFLTQEEMDELSNL